MRQRWTVSLVMFDGSIRLLIDQRRMCRKMCQVKSRLPNKDATVKNDE